MLRGGFSATALLRKADAARDGRRWSEAADYYQKYLRRKPEDAAIWVQLGHARKESRNLDGAEQCYARALALTPNSADVQLQMGHLLKLRGEAGRAIAHYYRAYELDATMDSAVDELRALGETPEEPLSESQTQSLREGLEGVVHDLNGLRLQYEPVFRSIAEFLAGASSLQSFGFELARHKRAVQERLSRLDDTVRSLRDRIEVTDDLGGRVAILEGRTQSLLGLTSDTRAIGFTLTKLAKEFGEITDWRTNAEARLASAEASPAEIAALDDKISKRLATDLAEFTSWRAEVEMRLSSADTLPARMAALDDKITMLRNELGDEVRRRGADSSAEVMRSCEALMKLADRFDQFAETPPAIGARLIEAIGQPDVMAALRLGLSGHFVEAGAMVAYSRRLSLLDEEVAKVCGAARGVDLRLANQISELHASLGEATARAQRAEEALAQSSQMQSYLVNRIEFVRREMMFEFRHGRLGEEPASLKTETRVINIAKMKAQRVAPHINLGCGHIPVEGYLNVDRRELPGVDIVAEADTLPFGPGEVEEIRSAHLLEHFPQEQLRRSLLPYWRSLLKPGGRFVAVVPDAAEMIAAFGRDEYAFENFREVFFGAQDYDGDYHYNMFTPESLLALLQEAGFERPDIIARGRRNGACFEFEIAVSAPVA